MTPNAPTAPSPRAMRRVTIAELLAFHPHLRDQVARAITATESPDVQDQMLDELLDLLECDHQLAVAARMLDCRQELEKVELALKLHDLGERKVETGRLFELEARRSELRRVNRLQAAIQSELTNTRRRLARFGTVSADVCTGTTDQNERKEA